MINRDLFKFGEEVEAALGEGRAVVALESTVIAHGLPRPQNLETARRLEQIVRERGATPATIAVIGGKLCVGLDDGQLEHLAASDAIKKISRRDLPAAVARKWDCATTVATTLWVAHRARIGVFATGGIGGVHPDHTDVSADLPELARTPLVVVCSGAKAILDLRATREWLETHGVTVVGYGCDRVPAFYTRETGLAVDVRVETPEEVAELARARAALGTEGALLVTVPVPEEFEVDGEVMRSALMDSLRDAQQSGITGSETTPFLLKRLGGLSGGATLRANIALLENNARVAADVARAALEKSRVTKG
ncbi:MAG TPA: pseudouridine-5'-phosphate glycosidase [Pyrinomonadaceae bacterium]|jgi:pseudouridine-5'-phosphate glycosidase|nr:pseudouridine-5'-phosphate glycosidase [Pyrinomonadaceae bacterium]